MGRTKTENYHDLFDWIVKYKREHDGVGPTVAEVAEAFNWKSKNTASYALDRLEEQGLISLGHGARAIFVTGGVWTKG